MLKEIKRVMALSLTSFHLYVDDSVVFHALQ
jgi:hypothetical protein